MKQYELLECANRHSDNPAVKSLCTAITEARAHAILHKSLLDSQLKIVGNLLSAEATGNIPLDNSSIASIGANLSTALSQISHDFYTLACVLNALGEEIDY